VSGPSRSVSTAPTLTAAHWRKLSPTGVAILRLIAVPLSEGYSKKRLASTYGISPSSVQPLADRLENELREIAKEQPDLGDSRTAD
jgi:hypothetical protein